MPVMRITVSTLFLDGSPLFDRTVTPHHEMIPDSLPVLSVFRHALLMPVVNVLGRTPLPGKDKRAMKYDK